MTWLNPPERRSRKDVVAYYSTWKSTEKAIINVSLQASFELGGYMRRGARDLMGRENVTPELIQLTDLTFIVVYITSSCRLYISRANLPHGRSGPWVPTPTRPLSRASLTEWRDVAWPLRCFVRLQWAK